MEETSVLDIVTDKDFILGILEVISPILFIAVPIILFALIFRLFKHTNFLKNFGYFILTGCAFMFVIILILIILNVFL